MSDIGYNADALIVNLDGDPFIAVDSKSITLVRAPVEVPTDDSKGWMVILPRPGRREVNASIEFVVTSENVAFLVDEWAGSVNSDITITLPDGRIMSAEHGFFMGDVEMSGEEDGHVAGTGTLRSSGEVTVDAAPIS